MWTVKMEQHEIGFAQSITWWIVHNITDPKKPTFQTKDQAAAIWLARKLESEEP